jgi:hypothetical protein
MIHMQHCAGRSKVRRGAGSEADVAGDASAADGLQELSGWVEAFRITQVIIGMFIMILCFINFRQVAMIVFSLTCEVVVIFSLLPCTCTKAGSNTSI